MNNTNCHCLSVDMKNSILAEGFSWNLVLAAIAVIYCYPHHMTWMWSVLLLSPTTSRNSCTHSFISCVLHWISVECSENFRWYNEVLIFVSKWLKLYFVTNCMEQSPWEAHSSSASQEIPGLLRNLKEHYHVHKSLPFANILNQMHPVHFCPSCFFKIHSNIIFPSTPRSSEWSLAFRFSNKSIVCISHPSHSCYMHPASHPPWLGFT